MDLLFGYGNGYYGAPAPPVQCDIRKMYYKAVFFTANRIYLKGQNVKLFFHVMKTEIFSDNK